MTHRPITGEIRSYLISIGMTPNNEAEYTQRFRTLGHQLSTIGCKIRSDSKLCKEYIKGNTTYTIEEIGNIMCEMNFLYKNTFYKDKLCKNRTKFLRKKYSDYRNYTGDAEPCGYCDNGCEMCDGIGTRYWSISSTEEELVRNKTKNQVLLKYFEDKPPDSYHILPTNIKARYDKLMVGMTVKGAH